MYTYDTRMLHAGAKYDSFIRVWHRWHVTCDMTHAYTWKISLVCVLCLVCMCVTWLIHMRNQTHKFVCNLTQFHVWYDLFVCRAWRIDMLDIIHSFALPPLFLHANKLFWSVHMNTSCHTHASVMSHIWTSHITDVKESCHTYESVISHLWRSHVTQMNQSCHTRDGVTSHVRNQKWHDAFVCVTWRIHTCDITHPYLRFVLYDSFVRVRHDSFVRVIWLICACDMTRLCVWYDSFVRGTRLICTCDMTHSCMWHDSRVWLMHVSFCVQIFGDSYVHTVRDSYLM